MYLTKRMSVAKHCNAYCVTRDKIILFLFLSIYIVATVRCCLPMRKQFSDRPDKATKRRQLMTSSDSGPRAEMRSQHNYAGIKTTIDVNLKAISMNEEKALSTLKFAIPRVLICRSQSRLALTIYLRAPIREYRSFPDMRADKKYSGAIQTPCHQQFTG